MRAAADRDHQPPADRQLPLERLGHARAAGRHDDGVERRVLGQAFGAVGADDLGIVVAEPLQPGAGLGRKLFVALDGVDLAGDAAHHGGRVA